MKIALDYKTSTPIWRTSDPIACTCRWRNRISSLDSFESSGCAATIDSLTQATPVSYPIGLLIGRDSQRNRNHRIHSHLWTSPLAPNSLYRLNAIPGYENVGCDADVYVSSPEFCLLQAAAQHPLPQIILYGMEVCGTYSLGLGNEGLKEREALTSSQRITAYIEHAEGSRGHRTAAEAAPYILDGSASPMESKLAMKLHLPKRKGGMGFPAPILNGELPLGDLPSELAGKGAFRFDLWWPDKHLVVEYDSEQEHTGRSRIVKDSVRRNVIDYLELNLVTVTPDQLMNEESFALVAYEIAHHLGIRIRPASNAVRRMRRELNRQLFPWRYRR